MGVKSTIISAFAERTRRRLEKESKEAQHNQKETFRELISKASSTQFGREHGFNEINSHKDFATQVPLRDYEDFRPYIEKIIGGEQHVLWPGKPIYFAKTSGTTSGIKYIPITRESIPNHIDNARDALFNMMSLLKLKGLFDGKMIFLSGSPVLEKKGGISTGRLSGIVNHWIPSWLKGNQLPSYETNCIEDWEIKVDKIARETVKEDLRLISGIPPWVQMYYNRLLELSGKQTIREIFPNYQLFVYGGVNFEPYRAQLEQLTGGPIYSLETYPASEGFIAFQDLENVSDGLALQCNSGIFFEFIPVEEISSSHPIRLSLSEVQTGKDYAVVINSNAGLWGYNLGDTVEFVSIHPYRLRVTGRVKHFISAFGEHVIAKEVEEALRKTMEKFPCSVQEFTVAPQVNPPSGQKPFHEWLIEFGTPPASEEAFANTLNEEMMMQNIYYQDLIDGKILQPLSVRSLPPGSFKAYMQSIGKLGGQHKVPRLCNDRSLADPLVTYLDHRPKPS
ncbi:MAG TPA: GH3 auxin-responsive promoter family protein [Saprospiraceae bacterium]|nr:GH3 auxin-responsive promoter family protein [Saprospiraceae bacterium]